MKFTSDANRSLEYRSDVDGLRAVAVSLVLVFHFGLFSLGKAGFIGVDIFFVISGFLITTIIKKQLDDGSFNIKRFYLHRIRRLAPALLIVLLLTTVAGFFLLFPADLYELSKQILVTQTYVANIYFWRNVNYFGLSAENVYLLHTWSLAVEEQFYLLYPFFLLVAHKLLRRHFWTVLTLGCLLSFGLNIVFVQSRPEAVFYLLPTRAWELLIGGLIPIVVASIAHARWTSEFLGIIGLALIGLAVIYFHEGIPFPGYFALFPTLGTACLIVSGSFGKTVVSRLFANSLMAYIGRISYPLYLVHWPTNVFAKLLLGEDYSLEWRWTACGFSIALAIVIYHAIEVPVRRSRRFDFDGTALVPSYCTGLAFTTAIFLSTYVSAGFPKRFPDEVVRLAAFANDRPPPLKECEFSRKPFLYQESFCRIGAQDAQPEWLVYGDSHAWAAYSIFNKWLKTHGQAGLFAFLHACPPVNGVHLLNDRGRCSAFNDEILKYVVSDKSIRNVFLVSIWRQAKEARLSHSPDIPLTELQSIQLFDKSFSSTIETLDKLGKQIYVWEPVPGASRNVPLEMARAVWNKRAENTEISREGYMSTYQFFFSALEKNRRLIAGSFSPSTTLCQSGRCATTVDGAPAYFDNNHIAYSTADFWVRMMDGQLRAKPFE